MKCIIVKREVVFIISFEKLREYQLKRLVKKTFRKIFMERKILDSEGYMPVVSKIELLENGISLFINLRGVCSYGEFESNLDYIKTVFKVYMLDFKLIEGDYKLIMYLDQLEVKSYSKVTLEPYELLLGYNYQGNIIVDMRETPHLLISGLSGQGKTYMAKTIIKNLEGSADIILINAFKSDFKDFKGRLVLEEGNILLKLKILLESKIERNKPMYIFIDELLTLTKNKEINKIIMELLAVARHYNIFIVGIAQEGTKENLKFKNLFNARVCFKLIEDSSYKAILGCSVQDQLTKQEFYLYSNGLYRGRTFQV